MNIIDKIKRRVYIKEHFKNIETGLLPENLEATRDLLYNYRDVLSGYEFICFDRLIRKF